MGTTDNRRYSPVKLMEVIISLREINLDEAQTFVAERAPICGMTREAAIAYAIAAYGEDGAIENNQTREIEEI